MFIFILLTCFCLFILISIYLVIYSPYRIHNFHGFIILFLTFTIHSIFIGILPFCQIYLLYFLLFIDYSSFHCFYHSLFVIYSIIESFFFLFTIEEARLLNTRPLPPRIPLPKNYAEQFIERICNVYEKSHEDFRVCFIGWFHGLDKSSSSCEVIYEDNILEYIAMSTYGVKYWNEMTEEQQEYIEELFYQGFLRKYPSQKSNILSGYNQQIRLKHPYRDVIQYTHYPYLKYFLFACVRSISVMILQTMGYEYHSIDNVTFYVRKYSKKNDLSAILFLHGLSLGTSSYYLFIRRLSSLNRTIILLDHPGASMRLQTEIPSMSNILSSIKKLLHSLDQKHLVTIGHSYGTFVQSCIIKQLPKIVKNQVAIFIDPVCFLIFDSRFIDNFVYRQPRTPNQLLLYTSCTEDLYSIYAIERHLCWYECNLWVEDIRQSHLRVHVFFSENDDIIPVSFVEKYLNKSKINTTIFPRFKHAQFLITPKVQDQVLETLHQLETN